MLSIVHVDEAASRTNDDFNELGMPHVANTSEIPSAGWGMNHKAVRFIQIESWVGRTQAGPGQTAHRRRPCSPTVTGEQGLALGTVAVLSIYYRTRFPHHCARIE